MLSALPSSIARHVTSQRKVPNKLGPAKVLEWANIVGSFKLRYTATLTRESYVCWSMTFWERRSCYANQHHFY